MFIKICPICNITKMSYKNKKGINDSIRKSRMCESCRRKRISEKSKGKPKSDHHKKSLSEAALKKPKMTNETKLKIGLKNKGLKRSEESKINYSLSKIGDKNPTKRIEVRDKIRESVNRKYKEDPSIKDKISESLRKYMKNLPDRLNFGEESDFFYYHREVEYITIRNKKALIESWDGRDYYDNEIISENFNLEYNDPNYPTIDHKISILHGFKNNYSVSQIADISNLCITKRKINSKKGIKIESDFISNVVDLCSL